MQLSYISYEIKTHSIVQFSAAPKDDNTVIYKYIEELENTRAIISIVTGA